jgi:hypothetical protein
MYHLPHPCSRFQSQRLLWWLPVLQSGLILLLQNFLSAPITQLSPMFQGLSCGPWVGCVLVSLSMRSGKVAKPCQDSLHLARCKMGGDRDKMRSSLKSTDHVGSTHTFLFLLFLNDGCELLRKRNPSYHTVSFQIFIIYT